MTTRADKRARPSFLVRWLLLEPPYLFHRLGLLGIERRFGQHWIAVTTRGRRTGRPHTVLLDIIDHDAATGRYFVQPGWPRGSDWVRNIEAEPRVQAQVGKLRFSGRVVRVDGRDGARRARAFAARHPVMSALMARVILRWDVPAHAGEEELVSWMAGHLVFYALEPEPG